MERLRGRRREGSELDELPLLELGVLEDQRVPRTYVIDVAALLELGACGL